MMRDLGSKLSIVFTVLLIISSAGTRVQSLSSSGLVVDAYTQKTPFNGVGINQPSDPFSPDELVTIYARVTYNNWPCENNPVIFIIFPPNSNNPFILSNQTDEDGIAICRFRTSLHYLGTWIVNVTTSIGFDIFAYDVLMFNVTWVMNIKQVEILDKNFHPRNLFLHGEILHIKLKIENQALSPKNVTITVAFFDSAKELIMKIENTFEVFHGDNIILLDGEVIPSWVSSGNASLIVNLYNRPPELGGRPYCPPVFKTFKIGLIDIAITSVLINRTRVIIGENLTVYVNVSNNGDFIEDFILYIQLNETYITHQFVKKLVPNEKRILTVTFNTSNFEEGKYIVKAYIPPDAREKNIQNNEYIDGIVTLIRVSPKPLPSARNLFIVLLVIILILLFLITVLMLRKKRRKRKSKEHLVAILSLIR